MFSGVSFPSIPNYICENNIGGGKTWSANATAYFGVSVCLGKRVRIRFNGFSPLVYLSIVAFIIAG